MKTTIKVQRSYQILLIFVVISTALFFVTRFIAGQMYSVTNDIVGQVTSAVDIAVKAFGVYLIVLFSIAILGLYVSKVKRKDAYSKGFKFSLVFCGILSIIYLILFLSA
jgi:hypothetical protein